MDRLEDDLRRVLTDPRRSLPGDWVPLERVHRGAVRRKRRRGAAVALVTAAVIGTAVSVVTGPLESHSSGLPASPPPTVEVTSAPAPGPTASTSPSPTASATTTPARPTSIDMQPVSVTAISTSTFWVLGRASECTGVACTALVRTDDASRGWLAVTAPPAVLAGADGPGPTTISQVRFANRTDGWAYGDMLWATHDGAQSWARIRLPGEVTRLEIGSGTAWALVGGSGGTVTLWRSPVSSDAWKPVPLPQPLGNIAGADLAVQGNRVVVSDDDSSPTLTWSLDGGATFTARTSPCAPDLSSRLGGSIGATWLVCATGTSARIYPNALDPSPVAMDPSQIGGGALPNSVLVAPRDSDAGLVAVDNTGLFLVDRTGKVLARYPQTGHFLFVGFNASPSEGNPGQTVVFGYAIVASADGRTSTLLRSPDGGLHWDQLFVVH